jgi:hypothetical protein
MILRFSSAGKCQNINAYFPDLCLLCYGPVAALSRNDNPVIIWWMEFCGNFNNKLN